MTTPAERAVLDMTLLYHQEHPGRLPMEFREAIDLLIAERAAGDGTPGTFGDLVAGDEIQSTNGKWYPVERTVKSDVSQVKVWLKGVPSPLEKFTGQAVRVRRSDMGKAVDTFATVLWSGPTGREVAA